MRQWQASSVQEQGAFYHGPRRSVSECGNAAQVISLDAAAPEKDAFGARSPPTTFARRRSSRKDAKVRAPRAGRRACCTSTVCYCDVTMRIGCVGLGDQSPDSRRRSYARMLRKKPLHQPISGQR